MGRRSEHSWDVVARVFDHLPDDERSAGEAPGDWLLDLRFRDAAVACRDAPWWTVVPRYSAPAPVSGEIPWR